MEHTHCGKPVGGRELDDRAGAGVHVAVILSRLGACEPRASRTGTFNQRVQGSSLDGPPNESATSGTSRGADLLATAVRPAYTCAPRPLRRSRRASLEGNRACLALEASSRKTSAGELHSSACCHGEWLRQSVLDRRPEPIHECGAPGSSGRTSSVVRSRSSARFVWSWSPSRAATRALADGGPPHARVWTGEHGH